MVGVRLQSKCSRIKHPLSLSDTLKRSRRSGRQLSAQEI